MTRLERVGWVVLLSGGLVVGGVGCGDSTGVAPQAVQPAAAMPQSSSVRLVSPETTTFTGKLVVTGDLRPEQSAQLGFPIPGTLQRIEVKRGQRVRAGDSLGSLDMALARASLSQAEAGLAAAEAQARMASDALTRLKPVRELKGVSDAQIVQAQAQVDLTAAQVLAARAQKEQAEVNLRYHTLRAPFAGVVTRIPDGTGIAVGPGMPLFALEATDTLVLGTSVTIQEAAAIKVGSTVTVATPATGSSTEASVRTVVPSADPMNHRVPVEVAVPNPKGQFYPYAFARAQLAAGAQRPALRLPAGALVQREGAFSMWVVGANGRARSVRVQVLTQEGDRAVVEPEQPLESADRVVDLPPVDIVEGKPLVAAAAPAGGPVVTQ